MAITVNFFQGNNGNGANGGNKSKRGPIGGSNTLTSNDCVAGSSGYYNTIATSGCNSPLNSDTDTENIRTLDVVDQLHDLFRSMSIFDETPENNREPIPPNNFLQAIGKLNPMFEGKYNI